MFKFVFGQKQNESKKMFYELQTKVSFISYVQYNPCDFSGADVLPNLET